MDINSFKKKNSERFMLIFLITWSFKSLILFKVFSNTPKSFDKIYTHSFKVIINANLNNQV